MHRKAFLCLLAFTLLPTLLVAPQVTADVDGSWLLGTGGSVPANSFIGGNSRTNLSIYVCRVILSEAKIVGRMIAPGGSPGPGCVYVKESQIFIENTEYRVLQDHPGYSWQEWSGAVPENAVKAGFGVGQSNNKHYICQTTSPESAAANIPGKFRDRDNTCQIVYGQGPSGQRTVYETTAGFRLLVKN